MIKIALFGIAALVKNISSPLKKIIIKVHQIWIKQPLSCLLKTQVVLWAAYFIRYDFCLKLQKKTY